MLVKELFEGLRSEFAANQALADRQSNWGLFDSKGKLLRPGLTQAAAVALSTRTDLIKKYGKLFPKRY